MTTHQHTHLAVYGVICSPTGVLLIHKARGPYTGMWDLPGGKVEFGEDTLQTLQRETMEETGLICPPNPPLLKVLTHQTAHRLPNGTMQDIHHIGIIYKIDLPQQLPVRSVPDGEDSLGARWFAFSELSSLPMAPLAGRSLTPFFS